MPLQISRILHAGYLFECDHTQIAFDPIFENPFSRNCHAFPDVGFARERIESLRFAAVFISHHHDDHCSLESLALLDRGTPIYAYCVFEELFAMLRELGFRHVYPLALDVPVRIGAFEVTPRRALDADVDSLFHIKAAGLNVLNVVDSWIDPHTLTELARSSPWDMVLWPFQTMRELEVLSPATAAASAPELPIEWREQLQSLNPRYVVPSSCQFVQEPWSWYNHALFPITYRLFEATMAEWLPRARVVRLNPSASVVLDGANLERARPLDWVFAIGEQNVDYDYRPAQLPPSTAEIARHFAPLSEEQRSQVLDYCQSGLPRKYASLDVDPDSYFKKPKTWRLSLYDHQGAPTHLHYRVCGRRIALVRDESACVSWSTEVPFAKLHAALELGESLSSMYVRINSAVFDAKTSEAVRAADVLEDPLIRCLFNGVFGAYQAAQLKALLQPTRAPTSIGPARGQKRPIRAPAP